MNPRSAFIALNMIEGIGPIKVRALTDALGSPDAVFSATRDELLTAQGVGEQLAEKILSQRDGIDVEQEEDAVRKLGAHIITPSDEEYPASLKQIHDPPLALYIKGSLEKKDRHAIAVVGSRRCTTYGTTVADRLSYQLAKTGFTVISGMARGIDTAAHRGALKGGGRTVAILGSALDCIYPPESEDLADAIAEHGAVVSEFALGREPDRTTFPYRNRVISGMSMGVLVVEAGFKSGALQTADAALDQGKSVFAVPGRVDSGASKGTNRLIQAGAKLVGDVDDVLEEFETLFTVAPAVAESQNARPAIELSSDEQALATVLLNGPVNIDTLTREAGLDVSRVSSLLIGLEMRRVVRMLPGRQVELAVDLAGDR